MAAYIRRTYEPFNGRFTLIPLTIRPWTWWVTVTTTWEAEPPHRMAPTVVFKAPFLPFGLGVGWWLDTGIESLVDELAERKILEEEEAAYARYVAVNGEVDREDWAAIRREIGALDLDPDEEMLAMQERGVFG